MSAFSRTDHVAQYDFTLYEFDTTGEGGVAEYSILLDGQARAIVVHFEGGGGNADVLLDGVSLADQGAETMSQKAGTKRLLLKKIQHRVQNLFVKARAAVGSTFKISILVINGVARRAWAKLSCPICKKLVRFLVSTILTGLGVPDFPMNGLIPEFAWERLRKFTNAHGDSPAIVKQILEELDPQFLQRFIEALRQMAGLSGSILEPLDGLITKMCTYLGFCRVPTPV